MARTRDAYLGNAKSVQPCVDDHLAGKFHPATLQLQCSHRFPRETAEAAIEVATFLAGKKHTPYCGQKRIAEMSVHKWHRTRDNAAPKAVSHDQVVAGAQLFYEGKQSGKVVASVQIS